jgi:tRNA U34 5-carboxymethylaminomethyl modifying GTPase MnmE/TrmE
MNHQKLVSFSEKLNQIANSSLEFFGPEIDIFKRANGIDEPAQLQQTFAQLNDDNRLLNIGIVGRVKAGKSSLLNALVFNGESTWSSIP